MSYFYHCPPITVTCDRGLMLVCLSPHQVSSHPHSSSSRAQERWRDLGHLLIRPEINLIIGVVPVSGTDFVVTVARWILGVAYRVRFVKIWSGSEPGSADLYL